MEVKQRRSSFNSGSQVLGVEIGLEIKMYLTRRDDAYLDFFLYIHFTIFAAYPTQRTDLLFRETSFLSIRMIFLDYILFLFFNC